MGASKAIDFIPPIADFKPAPARDFENVVEVCELHEKWTQTFLDGDGIPRSLPQCPQCAKEAHARKLTNRASIPLRFQDRTLQGYQATTKAQREALKVAWDFAEDFAMVLKIGRCLTMIGKPGTGKTHLACGIANHIMAKGYSALFITVSDAIRTVRSTWKGGDRTEESVLRGFTDVDLLILDEVGVQFGTDAEQVTMFEIINRRYQNRRPTIILSNLPAQSDSQKEPSLRSYLGDRAFDRLREGGGLLVICDWESYRTQV